MKVYFEICNKDTKEPIISFSAICDTAKDIERWHNQYKRWYKNQDIRIQSIN